MLLLEFQGHVFLDAKTEEDIEPEASRHNGNGTITEPDDHA